MLQTPAEESAFGRVERAITDVPHVNLPQHRVCFPHSLQNRNGSQPESNCESNSPECCQAECQTDGDKKRQ
jgi:hypothetical protein